MAVTPGQKVSASVTNSAFVSRLQNSNTVGKIDLENIDTTSLVDLQRVINDILDSIGATHQAATDATSNDYTEQNNITNGDSYKEAIDKLDIALNVDQIKSSLATYVDDAAFETAKGSAGAAGDIYYNTTTDRIRYYDAGDGQWEDLGGLVGMARETPAGAINGVNTSFTLSLLPLSDEHVSVYVDGIMLNDSEVTISGTNLTLTNAPVVGQDIFAWYINEGVVASVTPPPGTRNIDYYTLGAPDITAKQITLVATPATSADTVLDVIGGTSQHYGIDYSVSGSTLTWNGLGLDGLLANGDVLRVIYDS